MDRPRGSGPTVVIGVGKPSPMGKDMHGMSDPEGEEEDGYETEAAHSGMAAFLDAIGIDSTQVDMAAAVSAWKDLMEVC